MDLIRAVGATILPTPPAPTVGAGAGTATVETPRGPATLDIVLHDGQVDTVQIDTPSARLVTLVPGMAEGREVADALVGIASLDLSPWEMDR
jgi:Ni,Fe-hydrogenase III large subunit